ncbi:voltage-dependent anion channel [Pterulicium gracile]|uniref:Voltage-dependent anion channel n=1 Tax=Pterulicium gracile TaxID=1884261 RepID=A0A5C3QBU6_9AGAR|nr:voltage-dependent anion channel [Pterula gracilis]
MLSRPGNEGIDAEKASPGRTDFEANPPISASFKDRIAHFTWPWFATTMSTGAIAVVLASTPNQFRGLQTIGKIFYILNLVLFLLFTTSMALRAWWFPRRFKASLHHPVEGLFFGSYWVSVSLILNGAQSYGVPSAGAWLPRALLVVFWMYCAVVLCVAIGQYFVLFQEERLKITDAVPAWIFPIYPLLVVGLMAGTMLPSQSGTQAFNMWVGAIMLQGLSWTVALMMYTIYMQRLMTSKLPSPSTRPGMYVSVGPAGYTAAGLISLGERAPDVVREDFFNVGGVPDGSIIRLLGVLSGTFIVIFAFWFFCVSTIAVVRGVKKMSFTLNWWAFVFPNAGLTLAAVQLGTAYSSPAINGICSALTLLLVIMWIVVAVAHVRAFWMGKIMWPGRDEDKDMTHLGWGKFSA